jgi:hypothetical protein
VTHLLESDRLTTLCGLVVDYPQRSAHERRPCGKRWRRHRTVPQGRLVRGYETLAVARHRPPVCETCETAYKARRA